MNLRKSGSRRPHPHPEQLVRENDGYHRLHHGHRPWHDAGIVTATRNEIHVNAVAADRLLLLTDRRRRLEGHADRDDLACMIMKGCLWHTVA